MKFNKHPHIEGQHAFLSPSNYHWLNYDDQKLAARYTSVNAAARGSRLHALAHDCIELGVKLPKLPRTTLNMYVNDAIKFKMASEVPLFYSENCYGTPDSISFRKELLRVHDLKTGITKASFRQLEVYGAIFCLEYGVDPMDIDFALRIYQNDKVLTHEPYSEVIKEIMDKIIYFDEYVQRMKEGESW